MTCVILQPSYIPWRGYFHQIQRADFFVFYDDVQYDKHGWRNRNRIKTAQGPQWLTIPVNKKGNLDQHRTINEIEISWDRPWNKKHRLSIQQAYREAPFFGLWEPFLVEIYSRTPTHLAPFTIDLTIDLARRLGIAHTRFLRSSDLSIPGHRTERLIAIVKRLGCDRYVSGPSAKDYLEEERFADAGISLEYITYDYPPYPQLYPPFDPQVSILDLLFMIGPNAGRQIWG
jgi:WbqC-like protein family